MQSFAEEVRADPGERAVALEHERADSEADGVFDRRGDFEAVPVSVSQVDLADVLVIGLDALT